MITAIRKLAATGSLAALMALGGVLMASSASAATGSVVSPDAVWICVTGPGGIVCIPVPPKPQSPVIWV